MPGLLLLLFFLSYLELLGTFRKLVGLKKSELSTARNRTKVGLDKVSSFALLSKSDQTFIFTRDVSVLSLLSVHLYLLNCDDRPLTC